MRGQIKISREIPATPNFWDLDNSFPRTSASSLHIGKGATKVMRCAVLLFFVSSSSRSRSPRQGWA